MFSFSISFSSTGAVGVAWVVVVSIIASLVVIGTVLDMFTFDLDERKCARIGSVSQGSSTPYKGLSDDHNDGNVMLHS